MVKFSYKYTKVDRWEKFPLFVVCAEGINNMTEKDEHILSFAMQNWLIACLYMAGNDAEFYAHSAMNPFDDEERGSKLLDVMKLWAELDKDGYFFFGIRKDPRLSVATWVEACFAFSSKEIDERDFAAVMASELNGTISIPMLDSIGADIHTSLFAPKKK